MTVADNSSVIVDGALPSSADVTMGENSTLNITETGSLETIDSTNLNLQDSTKLKVDGNTARTDIIQVAGVLKVNNKTAADDEDLVKNYLASQNTSDLASGKEFTGSGTVGSSRWPPTTPTRKSDPLYD